MKLKEQEKHRSAVRTKVLSFIKKKRLRLKNINYMNMCKIIKSF
jgi:hypothetical protein